MSFQIAAHQAEHYQVNTEVFSGPLDLLLELIERAELDITRLALAQVTDQYLDYLRQLQHQNAAEVSAFVVIASRLVQIKSAALLPRPPAIEATITEEDPGEALARQLILYKRFKELAGYLQQREEDRLRTYLRLAPPPHPLPPARLDLSGVTLQDLVNAAWSVFYNKPTLTALDRVVSMPRITIREKIQTILHRLRTTGMTTFRSLLKPNTSRVEVVVTFLALLELVKRRIVAAQQQGLFTDIEVQPAADLNREMENINWEEEEEEEEEKNLE
ncbi:MAG: segregation/condensation protein A [Chloroflexota bacterium]